MLGIANGPEIDRVYDQGLGPSIGIRGEVPKGRDYNYRNKEEEKLFNNRNLSPRYHKNAEISSGRYHHHH